MTSKQKVEKSMCAGGLIGTFYQCYKCIHMHIRQSQIQLFTFNIYSLLFLAKNDVFL